MTEEAAERMTEKKLVAAAEAGRIVAVVAVVVVKTVAEAAVELRKLVVVV